MSLQRPIQGLFDNDLECHDIDLVETLPPLVSVQGIEVISESPVGLDDVVGTGEEPDLGDVVVTGASQKDHVPSGSPRSL